ncbi:MAG: radical SAM protein [Nitrospirae bacterium]|nr:radical SAM protein [Nitrospirota bacterium]
MGNGVDITCKLGFSDNEIAKCLKKRGLLSIELEFTKKCNLRCLYCYSSAGEPLENELSHDELKSVIFQAKELGAKKAILLGGGEPLLYQRLTDIIGYINSLGLQHALFTNGTLITAEIADYLYKNRACVVIKSNSQNPEIQDLLAGVNGAFKNIKRGLQLLMDAGYPGENHILGIQTVICRQNIDELPSMWIWARERGIIPYFETLTYQGRARKNPDLTVSVSEIKTIFEQLEMIDRERFGILWESRPPVAAFTCKRHLYSCLVNSQGYVQPCTGIDISVGNIRERRLEDILRNSPAISNLRNIYKKIEGVCKTCEYNQGCYGCRGNAYQMTGNYLASDSTCWRCEKVRDEGSPHICKQ